MVERLGAFGQIAVIASLYGSSFLADRYFIASIVPLIIGAIAAEALFANILPALVRCESSRAALTAAGFWLSAVVLAVVTAAYLGIASFVVSRSAPTGSNDLGIWYALAPLGFLMGLSGYLGGVLTYCERYVWPPFRSAVASLGGFVLMLIVASRTHSLLWVSVAVTTGYALAFTALLVDVRRALGGIALGFPDLAGLRVASRLGGGLVAPVIGGLLGGQVFVLLERALASTLGVGAVSTLAYARGIAFTPVIIAQAIALGVYPGMVRAYEAADLEHVRGTVMRGIRLTLFLGGALGSFLLFFGPETIDVLLRRGALNTAAADRSGTLLAAFSLALLGNMLLILLARIFYAIAYFRAVIWTQIWALVVYASLALPLRAAFGTTGLAVAFGIAETSASAYALALAGRRTRLPIRLAFASAVMPALLHCLPVTAALGAARVAAQWGLVGPRALSQLLLGLGVGAVVGFPVLWMSGWPEVGPMKRRLRGLYSARAMQ